MIVGPTYEVDAETLRELGAEGPYTAEVELIGQMIPVNLIAEISFMGFEYGMSPRRSRTTSSRGRRSSGVGKSRWRAGSTSPRRPIAASRRALCSVETSPGKRASN